MLYKKNSESYNINISGGTKTPSSGKIGLDHLLSIDII